MLLLRRRFLALLLLLLRCSFLALLLLLLRCILLMLLLRCLPFFKRAVLLHLFIKWMLTVLLSLLLMCIVLLVHHLLSSTLPPVWSTSSAFFLHSHLNLGLIVGLRNLRLLKRPMHLLHVRFSKPLVIAPTLTGLGFLSLTVNHHLHRSHGCGVLISLVLDNPRPVHVSSCNLSMKTRLNLVEHLHRAVLGHGSRALHVIVRCGFLLGRGNRGLGVIRR